MAKIYPCGGIGKHIGGCECNNAKPSGGRRKQKPGRNQGMFLDSLVRGKQPRPSDASGGASRGQEALEVMKERGWVKENDDFTYTITDAGRRAYRDWLED